MGLPDPATHTLSDLATLTGIPERTIRSYITRGLLPPPDGRGRAASYGPAHLERLQFLQRVRAAVPYEVPLALLEKLLRDLPSSQISRIARGEEGVTAVPVMQDLDTSLLRRKRGESEPSILERSSAAMYAPLDAPSAASRERPDEMRQPGIERRVQERPAEYLAAQRRAREALSGTARPEIAGNFSLGERAPELPETWTTLQVTPNLRLSMRGEAPVIAKQLTALAERLRQWLSHEDFA